MVSLRSWFLFGREENLRSEDDRRNQQIKAKAAQLDLEAIPKQFQKWEAEKEHWETVQMIIEDRKAFSARVREKFMKETNEIIEVQRHLS